LNSGGVPQLNDPHTRTYFSTCSYDPNDKLVEPPGVTSLNLTLMTDTLDYTIRFQNTGNDTAITVVLLDTLDTNLDINTFQLVASSHSVQTEIEASGAIRFAFDNIMLPDSNVNEAESHGFVEYRILAKSGLPDGTPVYNTAHIFFDFNPDVVTNTTFNTMVYTLSTGLNESAEHPSRVLFYPNPMQQSALLQFENELSQLHTLRITTITGSVAMPDMRTIGTSLTIKNKSLSPGIYFYQLVNEVTGKSFNGKFVVE
jgi:uncharacterized repeat protein (TIGR01451 family)